MSGLYSQDTRDNSTFKGNKNVISKEYNKAEINYRKALSNSEKEMFQNAKKAGIPTISIFSWLRAYFINSNESCAVEPVKRIFFILLIS